MKIFNIINSVGIASIMALSGCASRSDAIGASYVSPLQFSQLSCQQLGREAERISARASQLAGIQDSKATNDAIATGVAIVVFWPAAFLIRGDSSTAPELARLKGEMNAIERVATEKNCAIRFRGA
jgi:hypothetical protein